MDAKHDLHHQQDPHHLYNGYNSNIYGNGTPGMFQYNQPTSMVNPVDPYSNPLPNGVMTVGHGQHQPPPLMMTPMQMNQYPPNMIAYQQQPYIGYYHRQHRPMTKGQCCFLTVFIIFMFALPLTIFLIIYFTSIKRSSDMMDQQMNQQMSLMSQFPQTSG